jgi:hypothetical protein
MAATHGISLKELPRLLWSARHLWSYVVGMSARAVAGALVRGGVIPAARRPATEGLFHGILVQYSTPLDGPHDKVLTRGSSGPSDPCSWKAISQTPHQHAISSASFQ